MPFDAINIPYGFEALCPPGLGMGRYAEISSTFMKLLPRLLPVATIPRVSAIVDAVGMESNNGYDLLFCILVLTVPGFYPTLPLSAPVWTSSMDLFQFCHSHHFYFCIQGKKGIFFDNHTKSGIFLCAIRSSEYADIVQCCNPTLISTVATTTMVDSHTTSALMVSRRLSIHIQLLVFRTLATYVSTRRLSIP
jgi:hypothetical protein